MQRATVALAAALLGGALLVGAEEPVPDGRTHYLEDVSGEGCIACHASVGEEWRRSTHATAWVDERYQAELARTRRKQACWGCHVPESLSLAELPAQPAARETNRHLGVHCASCHLAADGETVLGPEGRPTPAHPTERSELFDTSGDSRLCVSCHQTTIGPVIGVAKDFVTTDQAGLGLSCVGCHMPAVTRPWAEDSETGEPGEARRGRSHDLLGPRHPSFVREAFRLEARFDPGGAVVSIENQAGHRVPGLLERRFVFRARLFDGAGDPVGEGELTIDPRAYLPVEGTRELRVEGSGGARLELIAQQEAPGFERPVVFLERAFEP